MPGNVFVDPSAPDEPTASSVRNLYAKKVSLLPLASPCFQAQGDPQRNDETNKDTQRFTILTRDLPETYRLGSLLLSRK